MTYELLVGIPPYYDRDRDVLFENIKGAKLKMPRTISFEARDFIIKVFFLFYIFYTVIE